MQSITAMRGGLVQQKLRWGRRVIVRQSIRDLRE